MRKHSDGFLHGVSREQRVLLPDSIDDYVPENSPVRFIDAFVDKLDLKKCKFTSPVAAQAGRPAYNPRALIKLLVYGYLHSLTSCRRLAEAAIINLEVKWLLQDMQPCYKVINTFHTENSDAFREVFKQFNRFCRELDLFSREVVAVDGAKFKAVNSEGRYIDVDRLKKIEERANQRIDKYQQLLRESQEAETLFRELSKEEVQSKLDFWTRQQKEAKQQRERLEAQGKTEEAQTDTDSKRMSDRKHKHGVIGYNVQMAVDGEHHMIAAIEATLEKNDLGSLSSMATAVQQELDIDPHNQQQQLTVLADAGYHQADQLQECEQNNIKAIVPAPKTSSGKTPKGEKVFPRERFTYHKEDDSYQCPGGQNLPHKSEEIQKGARWYSYYNPQACAGCPLKAQCTTSEFRRLRRRHNQDVVERAAQIHADSKEIFRQRKSTVEHVFGTLRNRGQDKFRRRGKTKVQGELSLSALAYNITRAINILGTGVLINALQT